MTLFWFVVKVFCNKFIWSSTDVNRPTDRAHILCVLLKLYSDISTDRYFFNRYGHNNFESVGIMAS